MMHEAEQWLWRLAGVAQGAAPPVLAAQPSRWDNPPDLGQAGPHILPNHLYRVMLEQLPVVTFLANLDGGFNQFYVSPQIEVLLGYTQQEWVSNPVLWYEALHRKTGPAGTSSFPVS